MDRRQEAVPDDTPELEPLIEFLGCSRENARPRRNKGTRNSQGSDCYCRMLPPKSTKLMDQRKEKIPSLAEALRSGALSHADYRKQLREIFEKQNPRVFAFLEEPSDRFDRLGREARELEVRFHDLASRPPLYGIAIGVKDIFGVAGMPTRAGSKLPPELFAGPEAACVTALKNAGALILGKTVTTEFAYFAAGLTRNPYQVNHTPGGSSSGSAAAVAAGMCPLALGSQTIGSVIRPAAFCGVVGFKPSYGRISTDGVLPVSSSFDTVGFFTSDVESAEVAASILVDGLVDGWSPGSSTSTPVLGVPQGPYLERTSQEGLKHFHETCRRLAKSGVEIKDFHAMQDLDDIAARHVKLMAAEMAEVHREWFPRYRHLYHPKTGALIEKGQKVLPEDFRAGLAGREKLRSEILRLMEQHGLTALVAPSAVGPAPEGLESTGDPIMNLPWTHCGLPAISLPSGLSGNGLPLGLQVVGCWQQDEVLLRMAARIEGILGLLPPAPSRLMK